MRVTKDGEFYRGSHISGPTHNFLRMRLQTSPNASPSMRILPAVGGCSHGPELAAGEVLDWISVGVERANEELGTSYGISEAEAVANDNRRPEVYAELARRIVLDARRSERLMSAMGRKPTVTERRVADLAGSLAVLRCIARHVPCPAVHSDNVEPEGAS